MFVLLMVHPRNPNSAFCKVIFGHLSSFYFASPFENPKQHLQKRAMAEPTFQQSALQDYVVDANDVLRFKLVGQEKDLDNESLEFAPEMCHQVKPEAKSLEYFFSTRPNSDLWRQREHLWISRTQDLSFHDLFLASLLCSR